MATPPKSTPNGSAARSEVIAICGGGNAGHALAVVLSQRFDGAVDWLVGSAERAELMRRNFAEHGLRSTGAVEGSADRLRTISADPAAVIPQADVVLIAVPAFAHAVWLERIEAHLAPAAAVGVLPTRGGLEFEASRILGDGAAGCRRTFFGLQTLPWSTRCVVPGQRVNFGAVKASVVLAALPAVGGPAVAERLTELLGTRFVAASDFLNLTLGNPGQFIHPGLMYGHFRAWSGEECDEDAVPLLYAHATDEMGEIVQRLSLEALAVARAIEAESGGSLDLGRAVTVHDWLRATYAHVTEDLGTVGSCFRTGPIQARKAPATEVAPGRFVPNFGYRYLTEDVPYGLVVTRALAELADVPTPTTDEVIRWSQARMGRSYLTSAGAVSGADARELPIPQNHGICELGDLIAWYDEAAAAVPLLRR